MGRSALSKLADANEFSKEASKLRKRDPVSARELEDVARAKRKSAIRQMKRRPKKQKTRLVMGVD